MDPLAIAIIADDPLARAGLALLLSAFDQVDIVDQLSSRDAMEADLTAVEVLLWDLGWEAGDTLPDTSDIGLPIVALLSPDTAVSDVWAARFAGYLPRHGSGERLVAAAIAAANGLTVIDPALAADVLPAASTSGDTAVPDLTPREQEVLRFLAEGLTNKAIARHLNISDHTVKFHVNAILGKLAAQSRTDAVVRATRLGLLTL